MNPYHGNAFAQQRDARTDCQSPLQLITFDESASKQPQNTPAVMQPLSSTIAHDTVHMVEEIPPAVPPKDVPTTPSTQRTTIKCSPASHLKPLPTPSITFGVPPRHQSENNQIGAPVIRAQLRDVIERVETSEQHKLEQKAKKATRKQGEIAHPSALPNPLFMGIKKIFRPSDNKKSPPASSSKITHKHPESATKSNRNCNNVPTRQDLDASIIQTRGIILNTPEFGDHRWSALSRFSQPFYHPYHRQHQRTPSRLRLDGSGGGILMSNSLLTPTTPREDVGYSGHGYATMHNPVFVDEPSPSRRVASLAVSPELYHDGSATGNAPYTPVLAVGVRRVAGGREGVRLSRSLPAIGWHFARDEEIEEREGQEGDENIAEVASDEPNSSPFHHDLSFGSVMDGLKQRIEGMEQSLARVEEKVDTLLIAVERGQINATGGGDGGRAADNKGERGVRGQNGSNGNGSGKSRRHRDLSVKPRLEGMPPHIPQNVEPVHDGAVREGREPW